MQRRLHRARRSIPLVAILFVATAAFAATTSEADRVDLELIRDNLVAVGVEGPDALYHHQTAVLRALDDVEQRMGRGKPTYPRARKLHHLLHRHYLRDYRPGADGVHLIPGLGRYNCLSGSIFYGLAARRLGFGVTLLHDPGHLLLRLEMDDRVAVIETTLRDGFDRQETGSRLPGEAGAPDLMPPTVGRHLPGSGRAEYPLESTVAFAWLNRAWRTLERGETTRSAAYVLLAAGRLPELETVAGARGLLARAFNMDYESGRFEAAYQVARVDMKLFPSMTTSRDRLIAVAVKRIEDATDSGDLDAAESILADVRHLGSAGPDIIRLERRAWPLVAAAAVRLAEWERARLAAHAYAEVEPDAVEAERLRAWIESREADPETASNR